MISHNKTSQIIVNTIMFILSVACVVPLLILLVSSFTDENILLTYGYSLIPRKFSLESYRYIFQAGETIFRSYGITIFVTTVGTVLNLFLTVTMAYPLSRKTLFGRNFFAFFIFFTMIFNGGLVPTYMMWTQVFHIRDTIWSLIFPTLLLNSFNIIMVRSYFTANIPDELIEAAKIDGGGEYRILATIILPMSKPIIATVGLMSGLGYWNDWQNGLYYLVRNTQFYSIQNVLNRMLTNADFLKSQASMQGALIERGTIPSAGVRMAIACIALVPVLIIYPFVQKAFVRGIVVGAVKG